MTPIELDSRFDNYMPHTAIVLLHSLFICFSLRNGASLYLDHISLDDAWRQLANPQ